MSAAFANHATAAHAAAGGRRHIAITWKGFQMPKSDNTERQRVLAGLVIPREYELMGVVIPDATPCSNNCVEAYSVVRKGEAKPSAWINCVTGVYGDKGDTRGEPQQYSLFDFAVAHGGFTDFKAAYRHFAQKAGVELPARRKSKAPADQLEFEEWTAGNSRLIELWVRETQGRHHAPCDLGG